MREFEQIITEMNNELNKVYDLVNSVSIVIVPEEELEQVLEDISFINLKLTELIKSEGKS